MKHQPPAIHTIAIHRLAPIAATIATACSVVLLASCSSREDSAATSGASAATSDVPSGLLAEAAPEGALSVIEARAAATPGEPITLRGKVGGRISPISEAAAILVLADEHAIQSCDTIEGDACATPWDYCCVEAATIAASTATIQVRGADGSLLRTTLRGLGGLKELSHLIVSGTVDTASTPEALIINATGIHVEKP